MDWRSPYIVWERMIMLLLLDFSVMYWNFLIYFLISCRQIVAIIQPLSQLSQSAVPWSPGSLLGSLPLPGSSSGNQQANLLFWLLLANSLQVCIRRGANLWRSKIWAQLFESRLALNPGFFLLCLKAFSRTIFCAIFRASNHQLVDKKN